MMENQPNREAGKRARSLRKSQTASPSRWEGRKRATASFQGGRLQRRLSLQPTAPNARTSHSTLHGRRGRHEANRAMDGAIAAPDQSQDCCDRQAALDIPGGPSWHAFRELLRFYAGDSRPVVCEIDESYSGSLPGLDWLCERIGIDCFASVVHVGFQEHHEITPLTSPSSLELVF